MFRKLFALFILAAAIVSCAKLPVSKSQKLGETISSPFSGITTNGFNEKSKVAYGMAFDDSHLYLKVVFQNRALQQQLMRSGLWVYFDPEQKKGKKYLLKIERGENNLRDLQQMAPPANRLEGGFQNPPMLLDKILTKVTWDANGKEFVFYRSPQLYAIDVHFAQTASNEPVLELKMPLKELPFRKGESFSIGLETGTAAAQSMNRPSGGMGGRGGGMPGGGGGGGRGGNMGGAGGGNRPSGMQPGATGSPMNSDKLSVWFIIVD